MFQNRSKQTYTNASNPGTTPHSKNAHIKTQQLLDPFLLHSALAGSCRCILHLICIPFAFRCVLLLLLLQVTATYSLLLYHQHASFRYVVCAPLRLAPSCSCVAHLPLLKLQSPFSVPCSSAFPILTCLFPLSVVTISLLSVLILQHAFYTAPHSIICQTALAYRTSL